MNADRDLLIFAAKAAGIEINWFKWERQTNQWNPLTDDGDALRLACQLHIDIEWGDGDVWAYRHASADGDCFTAIEVLAEHQPEEIGTGSRATRRAITRAAAEIGKGMQ
jgi:hypothetical protein